ncbi:oxidoreductase [Ralstonia solanacearum]|uniref:oxidoreductase n=1 Tax=Ralstonia solanacearum TaxID=305 RepID=UPI00202AB83E|nr:oxidoreductase [Ralstonia solanacearum]MCL9844803.1 oxidoreductase [Ralstonia solanacearum]MDC6252976.1 oxidoreductase [Ralstonia solanacearum]MDC6257558.1 oxidoreductase [Ralstonia solanacearum]MDC6301786.1 oxidoreductase [Ralstonia solanacearum]
MTDSQMLVAQGLAVDGQGAEQPRGPAVLVVGASGLVGRAVVRRLVAQTWAGSVTVLVRRPGALTAGQALPGRLRECVVDFERLDAPEARSAFAAGAHHFLLVSALGADARSSVFYNRCKGEAEAAVLAVGFPSVTVVRPSLLLGKRAAFRLGERVAQVLSKAVGGLVPKAWRPVPVESVAAALVTAARVDAPGARVLENPALLAAQDERPMA